ncbi:MAG: carboxypeptidase-like regulatory domain-containing protein [Terriglobia bacterium]
MKRKLGAVWLAVLALTLVLTATAQQKETIRTIRGQVVGPDGKPVAEALVHLKNRKTGTVLTVVTDNEGRYLFAGASRGVDFELYAEFQDLRSRRKKLSRLDRRMKIVLTFDLKKPKKKSAEPSGKESNPTAYRTLPKNLTLR